MYKDIYKLIYIGVFVGEEYRFYKYQHILIITFLYCLFHIIAQLTQIDQNSCPTSTKIFLLF